MLRRGWQSLWCCEEPSAAATPSNHKRLQKPWMLHCCKKASCAFCFLFYTLLLVHAYFGSTFCRNGHITRLGM